MKTIITFFLLSISFAHAQFNREDYKDQANMIMDVLDQNLPHPAPRENDWDRILWKGKTAKGLDCVISRNGNWIGLVEHPDLSESQKTYNDYSFEWDVDALDSSILGFRVKPTFKKSTHSLEASATIARGTMGVSRLGLKLNIDGSKFIISIRNKTSLLSNYKDCVF